MEQKILEIVQFLKTKIRYAFIFSVSCGSHGKIFYEVNCPNKFRVDDYNLENLIEKVMEQISCIKFDHFDDAEKHFIENGGKIIELGV